MPEAQTPAPDSAEQTVVIDVARPATRHHAAVKPVAAEPKVETPAAVEPTPAASVAVTEQEPVVAAPAEPEKKEPEKPARDPRIDELYRTRAENARYKEELERLKAQPLPAQTAAPAAPAKAEPEGKPVWDADKWADKGGYDGFVEALTDWKADQKAQQAVTAAISKFEEKQKAADTERAVAVQRQAWIDKVKKSELSDFDAVVQNAPRSFQSPSAGMVLDSIFRHPEGPKLAYHLAKHPEEVERIDGLSPLEQMAELSELAKTFAKPPAKTEAVQPPPIPTAASRAPAPITPLRPEAPTPKPDPKKIASENGADVRDFAAAAGITVQRGRFANRG